MGRQNMTTRRIVSTAKIHLIQLLQMQLAQTSKLKLKENANQSKSLEGRFRPVSNIPIKKIIE